jgi:hypothetical protein
MREALEGGYAPEESKKESKKIAVSASVAESKYVIETKETQKGKGPKNFNKKNNHST